MITREFGKMYHISIQAINKKVLKATSNHKNIIQIDNKYFIFTYTKGIGRGGKVLQIWSEPFNSAEEAEAFLHNYRVNRLEKAVKQSRLNTKLTRLERAVKQSKLDVLKSSEALLHTLAKNALLDVLHNQKETDTTRDVSHTLNMTRNIDVLAVSQHDKRAEYALYDKHDRIESSNILATTHKAKT